MKHQDRRVAVLLAALLVAAVPATGCMGRSEASIRKEFDAYVAGANACTATSDCVVAFADCPLGCSVAVRADRKAEVEAKANQLVADYRRSNQTCFYDCAEVSAACVDAKCTLVFPGQGPADGGSGSD